jgi:uncharacterized repeat protein (TIGR03847 family)
MPRNIFTFDPVERFVAGTVGEPGERTFFLQARTGKRVTSIVVEKAQVFVIAERMGLLLRELRRNDPSMRIDLGATSALDDQPLEQPIFEEFRAGVMALTWLGDRELISIELQALPESGEESDELFSDDDESAPDLLRVILTLAQAEAFAKRCFAVVNAGRLPCPFCGLPLDPRGHVCPRANGYRR